eukprot:gene4178-6524_t
MPLNQPVPNIESSAVLQLKLSKIFNRVVRQSHVDSDTEPLEKAEKRHSSNLELPNQCSYDDNHVFFFSTPVQVHLHLGLRERLHAQRCNHVSFRFGSNWTLAANKLHSQIAPAAPATTDSEAAGQPSLPSTHVPPFIMHGTNKRQSVRYAIPMRFAPCMQHTHSTGHLVEVEEGADIRGRR